MPKPLHELVAPDWAEALSPVASKVTALGSFLREEMAAGHPYLPAGDAVLRFVSAELERRQGEPVHRLAALVEVCEKFARSAREAASYNLDRRPVVLSLFADLSRAG